MKLTFWGASKQVTGSMYLLELEDEYKILIDCGFDMEKGRGKKDIDTPAPPPSQYAGSVFPFDASLVNVVLLTHAHIDHSGNLPNLVREGFEGQIICTAATYSLTQLLLSDSANLHARRFKKISTQKKGKKNTFAPDTSEWYVEKHVQRTEEHFFALQFERRFQVKKGLWITFIPAGHLLGAANILVEVEENKVIKKILFSGDIGRNNYPLLPDPTPSPEVDYLLCETTYGSRVHRASGNPEAELQEVIYKACVETPGRLIIPSFSVGRTQSLLFTLHKLCLEGKLPSIKVFADSPLAYRSTKTYEKYVSLLNQEAQAFFQEHKSLFDFENLIYVEDLKTSKAIANHSEPCIIISSSGMVQGGRVEHHIRMNLQNPYATILMIGYASEGTIGHELLNGAKKIQVGDKSLAVLATVKSTDIYSGHADQNDLLRFVKYQNPEKLKKVFLIHGEESSMQDFKKLLETHNFHNVEIPAKGQTFEL